MEGGVAECACCDALPPCDDPLLSVRLTWTGPEETIDYMGETFTNGQQHFICPDFYESLWSPSATEYGYPAPAKNERWQFGPSSAIDIDLWSSYNFDYFPGGFYYNPGYSKYYQKRQALLVEAPDGGLTGHLNLFWSQSFLGLPPGPPPTSASTLTGGSVSLSTGGNTPNFSVNPGYISDNFEGSITTTGGITVAWEKTAGTGWIQSIHVP